MGLVSNLVFGRKRAARLRAARRTALCSLLGFPPGAGFGRLSLMSGLGTAAALAMWQPNAAALTPKAGLLAPAATVSRDFPLCGSGSRRNCVVDGDTMWIAGEKIRVADINTPETAQPGCAREKRLGEAAKQRLRALVNAGPFELRRNGRDADRYGRKLRVLVRGGRSLGLELVSEGLAEPWGGKRRNWCA